MSLILKPGYLSYRNCVCVALVRTSDLVTVNMEKAPMKLQCD